MLIDDVTIKVVAGHGGRGAVSFDTSKLGTGPNGGRGGHGGKIIFHGAEDISLLKQFRYRKELQSDNGKDGRGKFLDGKSAPDLIIKVPRGTVITNQKTNEVHEITELGEQIIVAEGGRGGRGNFHFRSPVNTSPTEFEEGKLGETFTLHLELKLIADVGLIGFPNAGKSSLLNELTRAQAKVANYPFTTLEPNLGSYYGLILADIPGIIEGASVGKGLGDKFLRHIERTRVLFHLISGESDRPDKEYVMIRKELGAHHPALLDKKEFVFLSKSDTIDAKTLKKRLVLLRKRKKTVAVISIHDWNSMEKIKKILNAMMK